MVVVSAKLFYLFNFFQIKTNFIFILSIYIAYFRGDSVSDLLVGVPVSIWPFQG